MERPYSHNNQNQTDNDFGAFVLRQIEKSKEGSIFNDMGKIKQLADGFPKDHKIFCVEDFDFFQHPTSYRDSKITVYFFYNGIKFEECEELDFKVKEFAAYLIHENWFEEPYEAMNEENFNWKQYIELFLNWRGY